MHARFTNVQFNAAYVMQSNDLDVTIASFGSNVDAFALVVSD
jgi:hypothetical protein